MSAVVTGGIAGGVASGAEDTLAANAGANFMSALNNYTNFDGKGRKQSETISGG